MNLHKKCQNAMNSHLVKRNIITLLPLHTKRGLITRMPQHLIVLGYVSATCSQVWLVSVMRRKRQRYLMDLKSEVSWQNFVTAMTADIKMTFVQNS